MAIVTKDHFYQQEYQTGYGLTALLSSEMRRYLVRRHILSTFVPSRTGLVWHPNPQREMREDCLAK